VGGEGAIELKNQKKTRRQSWLRKANADSLLWMQKNSAQLLAKAEKLHTRKELHTNSPLKKPDKLAKKAAKLSAEIANTWLKLVAKAVGKAARANKSLKAGSATKDYTVAV
jgi:hypothetical protein